MLILTRGTADPMANARRQQEIGTSRFGRPPGDWDLIHGELATFTDPQRDLPPIDWLEGFRPGGHSMYQRVMVAVNVEIKIFLFGCIATPSPTTGNESLLKSGDIYAVTVFLQNVLDRQPRVLYFVQK